jgi:FKBP-type peptidyl-prolyl cis-trans isomerase FkpA
MNFKLPLIAAFVAALSLTACGGGGSGGSSAPAVSSPASLVKTDTVVGTGAEATATSTVNVRYTGWLYDDKVAGFKGRQFDTSGTSVAEFSLTGVVPGFAQGVAGMKVGGKRTILIPGALGYGANGNPSAGIAPGAGLVFDVELVGVR